MYNLENNINYSYYCCIH